MDRSLYLLQPAGRTAPGTAYVTRPFEDYLHQAIDYLSG